MNATIKNAAMMNAAVASAPTSDVEAAALARRGRREGGEIRFQCPHPERHKNGDAHPSARFNANKRVWRCDVCGAGGGERDLAGLLGVQVRCTDSTRPPGVRADWYGKPFTEAWAYRSADGRVLGYVARYDGADGTKECIPYFRRDGSRWTKGNITPRPLFGLDVLAKETGSLVWVTEGEKCAAEIHRLGGVAVTSPGGAKAAAKADWSPLRGRRVRVWPDNDEAGAGYGRDVARLAAEAGAASVEVLDAARLNLPAGGDVVDYLTMHPGATLLDLQALPLVAATSPPGAESWAARQPVWPEPLAAEALYGLAGDFVRMIAPHTEADPVALLVQFLTGVGVLIGDGPYFYVGGDKHTARLYVVLVGATSRGRKGSSFAWVRHVLDRVDPRFSTRIETGLSTGEGLIWSVRDPVTEWKARKGGEPEEVVTDPGVDDKRLLIIEPEYARALRACERDGNTLSPVLRLAWDGAELRILTKSQTATAAGAFLALVAHITLDELRRRLSETDIANGLGNRHLFVCVRRSHLLPDGGSLRVDDLSAFSRDLAARVTAARRLGELHRSPAATELWRAVYPELTRDLPGMFGAIVARAEAQVLRLSLTYALLDASPTIEPVHLAAALAVWRYAEDSARYIFGDSLGDAVADEILRALAASPAGLTRSDIRDLFGRNLSAARIASALGLLARLGRATVAAETTGGRPAERWSFAGLPYAINDRDDKRGGE